MSAAPKKAKKVVSKQYSASYVHGFTLYGHRGRRCVVKSWPTVFWPHVSWNAISKWNELCCKTRHFDKSQCLLLAEFHGGVIFVTNGPWFKNAAPDAVRQAERGIKRGNHTVWWLERVPSALVKVFACRVFDICGHHCWSRTCITHLKTELDQILC